MTICFALQGSKNDVVWNIVWVASCQVDGLSNCRTNAVCWGRPQKSFPLNPPRVGLSWDFSVKNDRMNGWRSHFPLKICIKTVTSCSTGPWNSALSLAICAIFGDRSHFARRCAKVLLFCPAPKTNLMQSCTGLQSRPRFLFTITNPSENSLLIGLRYPLAFETLCDVLVLGLLENTGNMQRNMKHVCSACRMLDHVDTPIPRDVQIEFCDN